MHYILPFLILLRATSADCQDFLTLHHPLPVRLFLPWPTALTLLRLQSGSPYPHKLYTDARFFPTPSVKGAM